MNELAQAPILAQIRDFLTKQAIAFREVHHVPTFTVDASIATNQKIAFNAGSLTDSVILDVPCYLALANPEAVFSCTSESSAGAA